MSKTVFKVGMKVYDEVHFPRQELEVEEINPDFTYPVCVKHKDGRIFCYTYNGRYIQNAIPTLSTTPYKVELNGFSQEQPLTKGQIVWVRDSEEQKWQITHFIEIQEGEYKYKVSSSQNFAAVSAWKFLTTKNPYENIE